MAGLTRLELATFRVTGGRSNQSELQPQLNGREKNFQNLAASVFAIQLRRTQRAYELLYEKAPFKIWLLGQDSNLRPND